MSRTKSTTEQRQATMDKINDKAQIIVPATPENTIGAKIIKNGRIGFADPQVFAGNARISLEGK